MAKRRRKKQISSMVEWEKGGGDRGGREKGEEGTGECSMQMKMLFNMIFGLPFDAHKLISICNMCVEFAAISKDQLDMSHARERERESGGRGEEGRDLYVNSNMNNCAIKSISASAFAARLGAVTEKNRERKRERE